MFDQWHYPRSSVSCIALYSKCVVVRYCFKTAACIEWWLRGMLFIGLTIPVACVTPDSSVFDLAAGRWKRLVLANYRGTSSSPSEPVVSRLLGYDDSLQYIFTDSGNDVLRNGPNEDQRRKPYLIYLSALEGYGGTLLLVYKCNRRVVMRSEEYFTLEDGSARLYPTPGLVTEVILSGEESLDFERKITNLASADIRKRFDRGMDGWHPSASAISICWDAVTFDGVQVGCTPDDCVDLFDVHFDEIDSFTFPEDCQQPIRRLLYLVEESFSRYGEKRLRVTNEMFHSKEDKAAQVH